MAPHRYEDDYDYDAYSDDSTLVGSRTSRRRRHRHRSPSPLEDEYARPRHRRRFSSDEKGSSGYKTLGKVALGVVFVQVVATALGHWMKRKEEEREKEEKEYAREKRRRFEKAKAKRRREEDRRDRERQDRIRREEDEWETEVTEVRRIGYVPADERSPSPEREPRSIEPPPDRIDEDEAFDDRRRKHRSRSRPAVDVT